VIIDVHTHIFPRKMRENRERYLASESAFKLLYDSPKAELSGAQALVDTMDEQGVDRAVTFGFPWESADIYRMHNDYILEAVARFPERLIGFGCFDPLSDEAVSEAARCITSGLSGIGELALYENEMTETALAHLAPMMELLLAKGLPVLIHTNEPIGHRYPGKADMTLRQIDGLVKRFPENTIILAHWGGGIFFYNLLKKEIKEHLKNVYFDTAASPFLYDPAIYRVATEILGPDKVLLGSDYPLLSPKRYLSEIEKAGLSSDDIQAICGLNAARVLDL
jgi:predicted TIM-barrel fold metal-dependent hydrolase